MAEHTRTGTGSDWQAESRAREPRRGERRTGWAGWVVFAGVILAVVGLFQAMTGLTALVNDQFFVVRSDRLVVGADYVYWGWAYLLLGLVAMVAAGLLLRGNMVGRILAAAIVGVGTLLHFVFLPAHPAWSALGIALNVLVLYAITVHGAELKTPG